jgi:NADPH:quinone reductase-like Zn-dependent oxidoreductase
MRAAVCDRYGPPEVVQIKDVPTPVPAGGELLVESQAATVNSGDARLRALRVPRGMSALVRLTMGVTKPRRPVLGFEVAGRVTEVASGVTEFKPGDRVVASRGFKFGCHAEYITVAEDGQVAKIPQNVSDEDAVALCFGGSTVLHFLERGKLSAGESILINGASGAVGTIAIQLAKRRGAEVTAVCSGVNVELVRSLGADHVIDYTVQDFTGTGERFDVIMDNHGYEPYARVKGSLKPGGRFLMVVGDLLQSVASTWQRAVIGGTAKVTGESYRTLMALAGTGAVKSVIDRVLPFEQIVEAHRRVDSGHKVGSVVLTFGTSRLSASRSIS